jgi:hypothetical protein
MLGPLAACFVAVSVTSALAAPTPLQDFLGVWVGSSTCLDAGGTCKDEQVTLRIAKADTGAWAVVVTAEKLVGEQSDTMGVIEMNRDPATGALVRELATGRGPILFRFESRGERLEGTLHTLPDSALGRIFDVTRVPGGPPPAKGGLAATRAAVAPLAFLEGPWRTERTLPGGAARHEIRSYRWGNDRLALHYDVVAGQGDAEEESERGFVTLDRMSGKLVQWSATPSGRRTRGEVLHADSTRFEVREEGKWSVVRRAGPDALILEPIVRAGPERIVGPEVAYRRMKP